jgi:hypothetical protein
VQKEASRCFTLGASSGGGSSDREATEVYGALLDCDGSGAWGPLLSALDSLGIAYVAQRRGEKFHCSIFFSEPIPVSVEAKPVFRRLVRFLQSTFAAIACVEFDASQADRFLPMTFACARRPDKPGVAVETVAREGAALDVGALVEALGYEDAGEPERAPPAPTDIGAALSYDQVRALVEVAAVKWNVKRPPEEPGVYDQKRNAATQLVNAAIEQAGRRAAEIDRDDLYEAVADFIGAERPHVNQLVRSAIDRALGRGKIEEVERDAGIADAIARAANESVGGATGSAPVTPGRFPDWHNYLLQPEGRGPLVVFDKPTKEPRRGAQQTPEGTYRKQRQPLADEIAEHARTIAQHCPVKAVCFAGVGTRFYSVDERNLATSTSAETFTAATRETCEAAMAGKAPTPATFDCAAKIVRAMPRPSAELSTLRWQGETKLALHELPLPVEGDWSAHKEFIDRCSCPDTVMAWVWTCFLPENETGREALFLVGPGNDGKSYWAEALQLFLGNAATASEILKGENRFELANLVDKRLVYFGDVRNPRPIHSKIMREIIAGAYLSFERKGKDMEVAYLHPRCLFTTNVEPRISLSDRAEFTRIRRINVRPLPDNQGDHGWKARLMAQMPAFLHACRKVYERFATVGRDLPITDACRAALAGGESEIDDEFDFLSVRLEFTGNDNDVVTAKRMVELFDQAHYKGWERANAYKWLTGRGARRRENGKLLFKKIDGKAVAVWRGVKEISGGSGIGVLFGKADA